MQKNESGFSSQKNIDLKDLQLIMLPLKAPRHEHARYYRECAACWEEVWAELIEQVKYDHPLFLDNLMRQDEAACLFTKGTCVGMLLFRTVDFSILNYAHDSYFKEWSPADLATLLKHGSRVFLVSHLTVRRAFRQFSADVKFKDVLMDIMIKRFKMTDTSVISGVTRRDRGIHDDCYKLGAQLIRENVDYMDGRFKVDLLGFYQQQAVESSNLKLRAVSDLLWKNRLDLTQGTAKILKIA